MQRLLRQLLREILEEELQEIEDLEEFSGVAALGGGPMMPLGVDATYPAGRKKSRRKKNEVSEASITSIALYPLFDLNGDGIPDRVDGKNPYSTQKAYEQSVECLARSFGGAESPFSKKRS